MAQYTTNYRLPLVPRDERVMTFLEWRTLINGTDQTSAMNIIDAELKTLEAKCNETAAGFSYDSNTGVLQLRKADGTPINGASVTIDLTNFYNKQEIDQKLNAYVTSEQLAQAVNSVDLTNYYTKTEALSKEDAASTYETKEAASETYVSKASAQDIYLSKADAETSYVSKTDAEGYLTKDEASETYATLSDLENIDPSANIDLSTLAQNEGIGLSGSVNTIEKIKTAAETASMDAQNALANVSDSYVGYDYDDTEHTLTFITANNERSAPITITGGGGGGAATYSVRLSNQMGSRTINTTQNSQCVLRFAYYLYYGTSVENQSGLMTVAYKSASSEDYVTIISDREVACGETQAVDVSNYLTVGAVTKVRITVSTTVSQDGEEKVLEAPLEFSISCVEMSISTTFDSTSVYTGNIPISFTPVGYNIGKTVYLRLDNNQTPVVSADIGTAHNVVRQLTLQTSGLAYGAHIADLYYVASDATESNHVIFPILFDNGSGDNYEMVGAYLENSTIRYGDTLRVKYVVYSPGKERMSALNIAVGNLNANGVFEATYYSGTLNNIRNNVINTLELSEGSYPASGDAIVRLVTSDMNGTSMMNFNVQEITYDYDVNQVTTGLVYSFRPTGKTNDSSDRDTYVYEYDSPTGKKNIYASFTGFNWSTDGYVDTGVLTLSGDARMNIEIPILYSSFTNRDGETVMLDSNNNAHVTSTGRTIEFELSMNDVTDETKSVVRCISENGPQFVITPQVCYFLAKGQSLDLDADGFILNEESIPCAYLKDNKRLRISFVVQPVTVDEASGQNTQCVNIYVNGEYANSYLYDAGADYDSNATVELGSDGCITKLYDIRMYNRNLSNEDILQNYMNAPADIKDRIAMNEENDVLFDGSSLRDISYKKALYMYPCLLIIGELSKWKGNKLPCGAVLTKPDGKGGYTVEFSLIDRNDDGVFACQTNVQGTSSQQYIRKNYKVSLAKYARDDNQAIIIENGKEKKAKVKYALKGKDKNGNDLSIGESTLCFKIDYMSTDHANTFNANIVDTLFNDKEAGSLVQNTIYGFRCLLFNMPADRYVNGQAFSDYPDDAFIFSGDGCLNNDKSNSKSFGLESEGDSGNVTKQQKWEYKNNSNPICFFKSDAFYSTIEDDDGNSILNVKNALESCYPDEGDLEVAGLEPNYDYIHVLYTWVCQRANFWAATDPTTRAAKKAIFKNEFEKHFNLEHTLVYYLFMEWIALCDNRAKNLFLSCKDVTAENIVFTNGATSVSQIRKADGSLNVDAIDWNKSSFGIWYTDPYDLDSCFGVDNVGFLRIPYYADWDYQRGGGDGTYMFSGHDSYFWKMFEEAFASEITARARTLTRDTGTGTGYLDHTVLNKVHIAENAELVCPAVINRDMDYKYQDAVTKGYHDYSSNTPEALVYTSKYKYLQRGSRTEQKESFIYKRSRMLYSKYFCDQFKNDYIYFRAGRQVSMANTAITVAPVQRMKLAVSYGDSGTPVSSDMLDANESVTLKYNTYVGNTDTVYIHGASDIVLLGDISKFYPYNIDLSRAAKLKSITIGSHEAGYTNTLLSSLSLTGNRLLESLNIENCVNLSGNINLSNNKFIREIYAKNTPAITGFTFADGSPLETLELGSPVSLVMKNMNKLSNFSYDSLDNLKTLIIENVPGVDAMGILMDKLDQLENIRLVGITANIGSDTQILKDLLTDKARGKYVDADGKKPQGTTAYPEISGTIHVSNIGSSLYEQLKAAYPNLTIEYDSTLSEFAVNFYDWNGTVLNTQYVSQGDTPVDPVATGLIPTPTRPTTAEAVYTFTGWDRALERVTVSGASYTAVYAQETKSYTIRWYNGSTLLSTQTVGYGENAVYNGALPTNTSGDAIGVYRLFKAWDKNTANVTEDMDVYATWYEGTVPAAGTNLADMTPMQIYAMTKTGILASSGGQNADSNSTYYGTIKSGDTINITLGNDIDYTNVASTVLYNSATQFDGNNVALTGKKLFDSDKSFTLLIDYKFGQLKPSDSTPTLVSCTNDTAGISLIQSSYGPRIAYCGDTFNLKTNTSSSSEYTTRDVVVIRHKKGDPTLYIYSSDTHSITNENNMDIRKGTISRQAPIINNSELAVGGQYYVNDGYTNNKAIGTIYKMKYWEDDLGDDMCSSLAMWPFETYTFIASGLGSTNFRMYQKTGSDNYAGINLYSSELLSRGLYMNSTATNQNGWQASLVRKFLNSRLYYCMNGAWRAVMSQVQVKSLPGSGVTSQTVESSDYMFIPSFSEVTSNSSSYGSIYSIESEGLISYFTTQTSRTKHIYGTNTNSSWWLRSPGNYTYGDYDYRSNQFHYVASNGYSNGSSYTQYANSLLYICFGFAI